MIQIGQAFEGHRYSSFSGHDIVAAFTFPGKEADSPKVFAELLTLSYSTHRQVTPVRTLGRIGPKGYVRGPRTIGGSLVFHVINRHIIREFQHHLLETYKKRIEQGQLDRITQRLPRSLLMDEIPPFNITITAINEFGRGGSFALRGCMILEEGQVVSVADVSPYQTYTFVAMALEPMDSIEKA